MDKTNKQLALEEKISELVDDGICIAFSGGVDSSLILKLATNIGKLKNIKIYTVTFETKLHPVSDVIISKKVAKEMGAIHEIIQVNEFEDKEILNNPVDRCYRCKKLLFQTLMKFAKENNLKHILDGTNADDLKVYRPGIQALNELGVISPLAQLDITKDEVRQMAKNLGISVASRPSAPCMATRLPYGTMLDPKVLENIDKSEEYIKDLGFDVVRVRVHGDIVRIEVPKNQLSDFLQKSDNIIEFLQGLGFIYITLDLEGFRSGSMDVHISNKIYKLASNI